MSSLYQQTNNVELDQYSQSTEYHIHSTRVESNSNSCHNTKQAQMVATVEFSQQNNIQSIISSNDCNDTAIHHARN